MKTDAHWQRIGKKAHHGICVPLFAIHTEKSCGIGEFLDLLPLIAWCKKIGLDCLQLLPLNDTGFDASPYNPLSSCALDPIYLSLWDLAKEETSLSSFRPFQQAPRLDRAAIKKLKLEWLRAYFEKTFSTLSKTAAYQNFLSQNGWLNDYGRFLLNKDRFGWKHWKDWPSSQEMGSIDFYLFLQYLAFQQMEKVRAFASEHSFFLMGDMPHLLSPDSADVWSNPELFHLDLAAGAPPDRYNIEGQNWGFPLFNWEAIEKEGYGWWKERLRTMERLYHLYRIDHVVGFFRIWAIEKGKKAIDGSFFPRDPALWQRHGQKILEMMIDASSMLPIAEDLGTIPDEVYPTLKKLGICGTKVLRWQDGTPLNQYEPFSMTTVSTPDMETLPLWWERYPEEAKRLAMRKKWTYEPLLSGKHQMEILKEAHQSSSYFHINLLQEYLYPFPDLRALHLEEDRINIPGTLLPTNWTYRYRPSIEEIVHQRKLEIAIRSLLQ